MKYVVLAIATIVMVLIIVFYQNKYMDREDLKIAAGLLLLVTIGTMAYYKIKDSM